jgi:hypothetical protein
MKRKLHSGWIAALVCISISAWYGVARAQGSCPFFQGRGFNSECYSTGSCGTVSIKGLFSDCIEEQCAVNYGDGCWPANGFVCAFIGCLNPFQGNCVGCSPGPPPADPDTQGGA